MTDAEDLANKIEAFAAAELSYFQEGGCSNEEEALIIAALRAYSGGTTL
jgi:hypothetical protein